MNRIQLVNQLREQQKLIEALKRNVEILMNELEPVHLPTTKKATGHRKRKERLTGKQIREQLVASWNKKHPSFPAR